MLVTAVAVLAFAYLFEVSILDSRPFNRLRGVSDVRQPEAGSRLRFTATAYCKGTTTASGVNVRQGIAAADPQLLPVGSVVRVDKLAERYDGIYTVMDTGPKVQGRHVDIYMWSCNDALAAGAPRDQPHRAATWLEPAGTGKPSLVDRLFRQRERKRALPAAGGDFNSQRPTPKLQDCQTTQFDFEWSWELRSLPRSRYCSSNSL